MRRAAVIVPVHDEEDRLGACLASVLVAAERAGVATLVVVALDACTDGSAGVVAAAGPSVTALELTARNVGIARRAAADLALRTAGVPADELWLATTDADTVVPPTWLADQLALADAGVEAVAGVVEVLDWAGHAPHVPERFLGRYRSAGGGGGDAVGHPHVHGANLGVRGHAYLAAGGFPALACGEDVALWAALGRAGCTRMATRALTVSTSARTAARAPQGFAADLCELADPA